MFQFIQIGIEVQDYLIVFIMGLFFSGSYVIMVVVIIIFICVFCIFSGYVGVSLIFLVGLGYLWDIFFSECDVRGQKDVLDYLYFWKVLDLGKCVLEELCKFICRVFILRLTLLSRGARFVCFLDFYVRFWEKIRFQILGFWNVFLEILDMFFIDFLCCF